MLRALLPSVEALPPFTWHDDFEPVFIEMKPQHLTRIVVGSPEEWSEAGTFSSKVLEAAPALESVELTFLYQDETLRAAGAPVLQCMSQALQNGALRRLTKVELKN